MRQHKILIVEDDEHIARLIKYNVEKEGSIGQTVESGEEALNIIRREKVDLVILDLMLPGMTGLSVCKSIKQDKQLASIPVIMLTAKGEEIDKILGLESGADDYLVKPFSPRELILRINAILRRTHGADVKSDILKYQDVKMDLTKHKVYAGGEEIKLTAMEFKLLLTFVQRKGRLQSRDQLLKDVWDFDVDVTTRTVDTHVKRLRQKMGPSGDMIETVRGYGYRLKDENEE